MAEETLVRDPLTREMLDAGDTLLHRLSTSGFPVVASAWLYFAEADEWRLVVATPYVEGEGPIKAYEQLGRAIYEDPKIEGLELQQTTVMSPRDKLFQVLAEINQRMALVSRRLHRYYYNGVYIEDAYVYFVDPNFVPTKNGSNGA